MNRGTKGAIGRGCLLICIVIIVGILLELEPLSPVIVALFVAALVAWLQWGAYCDEP